jgi:hypothetical protein
MFHGGVELARIGVTQEHMQNLMSQGYMTVVELVTYHVPKDPASPAPTGGYIMVCVAFYEWGFGVPSHRFLCLLLQFYGLELHHLTPSGILHIAVFVTLCEAYMGIEPHFDLWNYFFRAWLWPGSDAEAVVWGSVDIFVRSGSGIDPYFCFPMSDPLIGCRKVWFFLRNDVDAPLPTFTGCRPIPQPK